MPPAKIPALSVVSIKRFNASTHQPENGSCSHGLRLVDTDRRCLRLQSDSKCGGAVLAGPVDANKIVKAAEAHLELLKLKAKISL
jgi:hypothetical protein